MGNAYACCSSGPGKCCGSAQPEMTGTVGVPVSGQPVNSSELVGIDTPQAAPGMSSDALTCEPEKPKGDSNAVPSGDSAAGGATNSNAEDYQNATYDDGSTYTGQIKDGKRHGQGLWQSRTGQYDGQWKADVQHGKGRQTWSDGRVYDGQFLAGKFSGAGKMVWHTQKGQLVYEGEYKEDLKHGSGKFVWADGRTYEGEWSRGKRHGRGSYTNAKSEHKVGFWVDDKFERWEDSTAPAQATNASNGPEQ